MQERKMARTAVTIDIEGVGTRAFVFTPGTQGPWPAIIFFSDIFGLRPAMSEMAQKLADHGYYVLLPDMFWRLGEYGPLDPAAILSDPAQRDALLRTHMGATDTVKSMIDTEALLAWLPAQADAQQGPVAVIGYCLGGAIAFRAAGTFPDAVAGVCAFHPGFMVTADADSPHLLASRIQAKVLIAGADHDPYFDDQARIVLREALEKAGVEAEVTLYEGSSHGFAPTDLPSHSQAAEDRHWRDLLALLADIFEDRAPVPEPDDI
jgi:carboxymethylenebutenolidase